jgi:GNAT superfamily N-acetyltransferase
MKVDEIRVRSVSAFGPIEINALCDVLIDCVEGGASVSFMSPMTPEKAMSFWAATSASLARGERAVIVAEDALGIVGTVQVIWAQPENQSHRADVAKMLVHRRARRRGVGALLLEAAERAAAAAGKSVLVLDTASDVAERLYARGGWTRCGRIPQYALMPDGAFCDTVVFYKILGSQAW